MEHRHRRSVGACDGLTANDEWRRSNVSANAPRRSLLAGNGTIHFLVFVMISDLTRIRVRFSLWAFFAIIALFAVACALLTSAPSYVAVPSFVVIHLLLPAYLTSCVIYWKGGVRAFCIGALFPATLMFLITAWHVGFALLEVRASVWRPALMLQYFERTHYQFRFLALGTWMLSIVSGAMVVAIRDRAIASAEVDKEP